MLLMVTDSIDVINVMVYCGNCCSSRIIISTHRAKSTGITTFDDAPANLVFALKHIPKNWRAETDHRNWKKQQAEVLCIISTRRYCNSKWLLVGLLTSGHWPEEGWHAVRWWAGTVAGSRLRQVLTVVTIGGLVEV